MESSSYLVTIPELSRENPNPINVFVEIRGDFLPNLRRPSTRRIQRQSSTERDPAARELQGPEVRRHSIVETVSPETLHRDDAVPIRPRVSQRNRLSSDVPSTEPRDPQRGRDGSGSGAGGGGKIIIRP